MKMKIMKFISIIITAMLVILALASIGDGRFAIAGIPLGLLGGSLIDMAIDSHIFKIMKELFLSSFNKKWE